MAFDLTSPSFAHGEAIPRPYTCDGTDASVPLRWGDPPPGTRSIALGRPTGLAPRATKAELLDAMRGHVLAETRLVGRYRR